MFGQRSILFSQKQLPTTRYPSERRNPPSERRGANNSNELGAFGTSRFSDRRIPPSAVSNFLFFRSRNGTGESKKKESDSRDRNGVGNISETRPMDVPIFWLRKISRRVSGNLLATTRKKSRAARFHRVSQKLIDHLSLSLSLSLSVSLFLCRSRCQFLTVFSTRPGFVVEAARQDTGED